MDPDHTIVREQIVPALRQVPGFVGGYFLAPVHGIAHAVVVFESEDAARSAAEGMGVTAGASLNPGTSILSVDFAEVAAQA
jgi:hypothetical protein